MESELEYVKIYLEIQKIRFRDKFDYSFQIDTDIDCGTYRIIPLLLQPIVENAMVHGLEEKEENGRIVMSIEKAADGSGLKISVSDNGSGMDAETLRKLQTEINASQENPGGGIGLYNVQRRMKMVYGEPYGIEVFSQLNVGTRVVVTLPLQWKETEHESTDR